MPETIDILFTNALVLTMDRDLTQYSPGAVAVKGDSIIAVGTEDEIKQAIGRERWSQLKDFTDALYRDIPRTIALIDANYESVETVAKRDFPEVKLFTVKRLSP